MCAKQIEDLPLVGFARLLFSISSRLGSSVDVVRNKNFWTPRVVLRLKASLGFAYCAILISGSRLEPVGVLERAGVLFCRGASDD
jgi:hypothetical protein